MYQTPPRYYSYILRFWEDRGEETASADWRFSLEDPERQVRYGFGSLEELVAFLEKRCDDSAHAPTPGKSHDELAQSR